MTCHSRNHQLRDIDRAPMMPSRWIQVDCKRTANWWKQSHRDSVSFSLFCSSSFDVVFIPFFSFFLNCELLDMKIAQARIAFSFVRRLEITFNRKLRSRRYSIYFTRIIFLHLLLLLYYFHSRKNAEKSTWHHWKIILPEQ